MNFDAIHSVYFLGIGGIGMSALALYFHACGKAVAGYDLTSSAITTALLAKGISVHFEENSQLIPSSFRRSDNTLVVLTPAVPDDHRELSWFREHQFEIRKRAEVLGIIFNAKKGVAISGTHGKTSVTSMTAYIMQQSEAGCSAFLGGIMKNARSNLIMNEKSDWLVAEADEFDRSFLHLNPFIAAVTWVDADHLDIYGSHEEIKKAFGKFLDQVRPGGSVVLKKGISLEFNPEGKNIYSYSLDDISADFYAGNIHAENARYTFDIVAPDGVIRDIELPYPGLTNVENAVAAASVSYLAGVRPETIGKALSEFQGVQRRFDIHFDNGKHIYIDDYAHHPRELEAIIGSVRKLYSHRHITGVFQPHLYTRTRDFADGFAASLSMLDELILLDIYPAREKPIPGVTSLMVFDKVTIPDKTLCTKNELLEVLGQKKPEILLTMGAGDIDRYIEPITKMIGTW